MVRKTTDVDHFRHIEIALRHEPCPGTPATRSGQSASPVTLIRRRPTLSFYDAQDNGSQSQNLVSASPPTAADAATVKMKRKRVPKPEDGCPGGNMLRSCGYEDEGGFTIGLNGQSTVIGASGSAQLAEPTCFDIIQGNKPFFVLCSANLTTNPCSGNPGFPPNGSAPDLGNFPINCNDGLPAKAAGVDAQKITYCMQAGETCKVQASGTATGKCESKTTPPVPYKNPPQVPAPKPSASPSPSPSCSTEDECDGDGVGTDGVAYSCESVPVNDTCPSPSPTASPTPSPTASPTPSPTSSPTPWPTSSPTP